MAFSCSDLYTKTVLKHPVITILATACALLFFGYHIKDFRLDASSDSLVLENDKDLQYFEKISQRYENGDYLVLAYQPKNRALFSQPVLKELKKLRRELETIDRIASIVSILDVPLLKNPPVGIKQLVDNIKTLEAPDASLDLARAEFAQSPLYQELLVSADLSTTAFQINFENDVEYENISTRRSRLREKQRQTSLSPGEKKTLDKLETAYRQAKIRLDKERHKDIAAIRALMEKYRDNAELFLGGTSMIADDMITFVKNDLKVFGTGMFFFLVLTLGIIFKKSRWVILPMICCVVSIAVMTGLLGIFGWEVTVISSNFISLQLIVTIALTIHLIVRYRELVVQNPDLSQFELVKATVASKFIPCLFTTLTTIAGFSSLLVCDILPVITFGWMMCLGLVVSLVVIFLLFPAILALLPREQRSSNRQFGKPVTKCLAALTEKHAGWIYLSTLVLVVVTVIGISRLTVENSFIDYFKKSTEIYQGMALVDKKLGGTTPLDVIINFDSSEKSRRGNDKPGVRSQSGDNSAGNSGGQGDDFQETFGEFEEFNEFNEFSEFEKKEDGDKYWFTSNKMALIKKIHNYLDSQQATGKVLSLGTMMQIAESFNDGEPLDNFELALLYEELPETFKENVVSPYVSVNDNQARISVRIRDSLEDLQRNEFLKRIDSEIKEKFGLEEDQVRLAGIMVLYNNMLQSLFSSQILTMGFVVLAIFVMFMMIFRSVKIGLIALFPNLLASVVVLAAMGLSGHPLDMMTITIAAISIGIAVDNTIHYIHRFRQDYQQDRDYTAAMHRSHNTIGNAMFYTSLTIIVGFSILVFSNFIPTVLFGFLTGLAMLIALVAALSLLPRLLMDIRPF
ncbi:MAG: MMPL family transporter [Desulfobacteraceae bacterium]